MDLTGPANCPVCYSPESRLALDQTGRYRCRSCRWVSENVTKREAGAGGVSCHRCGTGPGGELFEDASRLLLCHDIHKGVQADEALEMRRRRIAKMGADPWGPELRFCPSCFADASYRAEEASLEVVRMIDHDGERVEIKMRSIRPIYRCRRCSYFNGWFEYVWKRRGKPTTEELAIHASFIQSALRCPVCGGIMGDHYPDRSLICEKDGTATGGMAAVARKYRIELLSGF